MSPWHLMLIVLRWGRWSEERCSAVRMWSWEAKHHVINGRAVMMVLVMLVVVHVANMHIIAHGAGSRVQ